MRSLFLFSFVLLLEGLMYESLQADESASFLEPRRSATVPDNLGSSPNMHTIMSDTPLKNKCRKLEIRAQSRNHIPTGKIYRDR